MRPHLLIIPFLFTAASLHAQPNDVAELFPADSLVYAEVNQPGAVGKEMAAFLKGSIFAKSVSPFGKIREMVAGRDPADATPSGMISNIIGSEMLKESARFKGVAVAITGFSKQGEPEFVLVTLGGGSKLPASLLRNYLEQHPEIKKFATVEGVNLYQQFEQFFDGVSAQQKVPSGPVFAHNQNNVICGSNQALVSATIRRMKGKEKKESLATAPAFKEISPRRSQPGILLYADAAALHHRFPVVERDSTGFEPFGSVALRRLLPPGSVRSAVARIQINDQGIAVQGSLKLNAKTPATLAELLGGQNLSVTDLNVISREAALGLTLQVPQGERRSARLLTMLDQLAGATGTLGPTPSEIVEELDHKKILAADVLGKVNRLTLAVPQVASGKKSRAAMPALLIHTDTDDAATALEAALPDTLELLGGDKGDSVVENIDGVAIRSLEARSAPNGESIHVGRRGKTLAIGVERKFVAACLAADLSRSVASVTEVADAIKSADRAAAAGVWNWAEQFRSLKPVAKGAKARAPSVMVLDSQILPSNIGPVIEVPRELFATFAGMPPLTAAIGRDGDEIRFELRQQDPKHARVRAIDRWFKWYTALASGDGRVDEDTPLGGLEVEGPPLVVPPPPIGP